MPFEDDLLNINEKICDWKNYTLRPLLIAKLAGLRKQD